MCYGSYEDYRRWHRKEAERKTEGRRDTEQDEKTVWSKDDDSRFWTFIARQRESQARETAKDDTRQNV